MTAQELRETLARGDVYKAVVSLGDRFVASTLTDAEAFWEGDDIRRELYAVLAVLHHANANGLEALIDYNEELWVPVTAYASKLITELQVTELETAITRFEELIASNLNVSLGIRLPRNAEQLRELQNVVADVGLEWMERFGDELAKSGEAFVGCADGELPGKVAEWMNANAERIAPLIS